MTDLASTVEDVRLSLGVPLSLAIHTDTGLVRANNEDAHGARWLDDDTLLVVVADGMGGHEAGEVASRLAVETLHHVVAQEARRGPPQAALFEAFRITNEAILAESREGGKRGMGTTAVVAWIRGSEVHVGTVGDSRLYQIRDGRVIARTVDHTRVQSLVDRGLISEAEARVHPEAGMLTRALGHARMSNGESLVPDVFAEPLELEEGDALVLSSDGLHDLLEDEEIAQAVVGRTAAAAAHALVERALGRGGHDNVTVAVVHVVGPPARPAPRPVVASAEAETDPGGVPQERLLLALGVAGAVLLLLAGVLGGIAAAMLTP